MNWTEAKSWLMCENKPLVFNPDREAFEAMVEQIEANRLAIQELRAEYDSHYHREDGGGYTGGPRWIAQINT